MERIRLIYEQIEEAKRYLLAKTLLQLRLALILLDNTAELMMYLALKDKFAWYDYWVPSWEPARSEYLRDGRGPKYTEEERRAAEKEFEPKLRILRLRLDMISEDDRRILAVCHKLRCEAFHRGELRPQILSCVARLLFLTVADLTTKLPYRSFGYHPGTPTGENAAFLNRFGFTHPQELAAPEAVSRLRAKLVEGVVLEAQEIAEALSVDLSERIDETLGGLSYVGQANSDAQIDHNLQYTQFWRDQGAELAKAGTREPDLTARFHAWQAAGHARFTVAKIRRWQRVAKAIARQNGAASALEHWWAISRRFAPLEDDVSEAVAKFDMEHG
jgi:hypothetical protein